MPISRSHFLSSDEEHAAVVLEAISAAPQTPRVPKPPPLTPAFRLVNHPPPPPAQ